VGALNWHALANFSGRTLTLDLWQMVVELEFGADTRETYLTIIILNTVNLILSFRSDGRSAKLRTSPTTRRESRVILAS